MLKVVLTHVTQRISGVKKNKKKIECFLADFKKQEKNIPEDFPQKITNLIKYLKR